MTARAQRISRIIRLRDNELQQTIKHLQQATVRETEARKAWEQASAIRDRALADRRNLALENVDVVTYLQAEEWLLSQQAKTALAAQQLQQAAVMLQKRTLLTHRARTRVKQLEQLQTTLQKRANREQELADRKLDDEIAQRAFRRQS